MSALCFCRCMFHYGPGCIEMEEHGLIVYAAQKTVAGHNAAGGPLGNNRQQQLPWQQQLERHAMLADQPMDTTVNTTDEDGNNDAGERPKPQILLHFGLPGGRTICQRSGRHASSWVSAKSVYFASHASAAAMPEQLTGALCHHRHLHEMLLQRGLMQALQDANLDRLMHFNLILNVVQVKLQNTVQGGRFGRCGNCCRQSMILMQPVLLMSGVQSIQTGLCLCRSCVAYWVYAWKTAAHLAQSRIVCPFCHGSTSLWM